MMKVIKFLAVIAFAFVSCSRQGTDFDDIPIRFDLGCGVKSAINSDTDLKTAAEGDGNGVAVYGTSDCATALFNGERVYWDDANSVWKYGTAKYWTRAKHIFAAIYPYTATGKFGSNGATFSVADGSLTLDCSEGLTLSSQDLMYSQVTTEEGVYTTVNFPMHHAFAALKFMVVNASTGTVTNIENPTLLSLKNKGTATVDASGDLVWTVDNTAVSGSEYTSSNNIASLALSSDLNDSSSWAYLFAEHELMVLPQPVFSKGISFSFSYTSATSTAKDVTFDLGNVTSIKNWEVGNIYTYVATITSESVRLNVLVRPWIEEEYELD